MEDEDENFEAMQIDELNEDSGDELHHETIEGEEEEEEEEEEEDSLGSSKPIDEIKPLGVSPDAICENDQEITSFVENDQSNEVSGALKCRQ